MQGYFDRPLFEISLTEQNINLLDTPYFYNNDGIPTYVKTLPKSTVLLSTELFEENASKNDDENIQFGCEYHIAKIVNVKESPPYGVETEFAFNDQNIEYQPLWVTQEIANAFGMYLVEKNQAIKVSSPINQLSQIQYEYGAFAGHWSPYLNIGNNLLTYISVDLEHHDFPHVFASTDDNLPLVISVGRYWPKLAKIRLADIWIPKGSAVYIPPKPRIVDADYIDLHHNRNAAQACWRKPNYSSVKTHTLLRADGGYFYWYWNRLPTTHHNLIEA